MPISSELSGVPRKALHIFYVLDTSGSMKGEPIAKLNAAMEETIEALRQLAHHNADAKLKIAVLTFSNKANWMQPSGPEDAEDFEWQDLSAEGMTNLGDALQELNEKLSQDQFLSSMTGAYLPTIIFMTDGQPTDDYIGRLGYLKQNKWFRRATKIGFAIGNMADEQVIADVCGSSEAVIKTNDLSLFAKMIRMVSVTSSMINSKPSVSGGGSGEEIVGAVLGEIDPANKPVPPAPPVGPADDEPDDWDDDGWDDDEPSPAEGKSPEPPVSSEKKADDEDDIWD